LCIVSPKNAYFIAIDHLGNDMRKQIVAGNWKMNGNIKELSQLSRELITDLELLQKVNCIVFPPAVYLSAIHDILGDQPIDIGAQNIFPAESGAYTGETSPLMLRDFQCRYVLVGHSERRHIFKEDENFIAQKFHQVKEHGMIPVLCVGETLSERENNLTEHVIQTQLRAVIENDGSVFNDCIIAYEPVWAIGTGKTASPEQAQQVHHFIRRFVSDFSPGEAEKLPILYGGSVNEKNARALFAKPDVDGGLVGGASLDANKFLEIVKCINSF